MSSVKEIEEHGEVIESSGSKDGKGSMKSLFDKEDQSVKLEIKNPEYVDLGNHVKTSKSAADAIAALVAQTKKMLPSLQVFPGDAGVVCNYVFMCFDNFHSYAMCCVSSCQESTKLLNASIASPIWITSMRTFFSIVQNMKSSKLMIISSSPS
jgi:hypothetical protein